VECRFGVVTAQHLGLGVMFAWRAAEMEFEIREKNATMATGIMVMVATVGAKLSVVTHVPGALTLKLTIAKWETVATES
jgi:hypothetical protein